MINLFEHFKNDKFAMGMGIELLEAKDGNAKAKFTIKPEHHNAIGTVQGGALFTLADFAFAAACNSHGLISVGLHTDMSFVKAVSSGTVYATAHEESLSTKIGTYNVKITTESGETVALFHGVAYRKKETLESLYK